MCPLVWAEFLGLWHLTPAFCVLSSSLGMVMQAPKTYFLRPIKPPQIHLKPPSIPSPPQNELFPLPEFAQAVPLPECSHSVFAWLVPSQSSGPNARPLPRENSRLHFFRGFSLILFFFMLLFVSFRRVTLSGILFQNVSSWWQAPPLSCLVAITHWDYFLLRSSLLNTK